VLAMARVLVTYKEADGAASFLHRTQEQKLVHGTELEAHTVSCFQLHVHRLTSPAKPTS
jgi:hypothetical protein